MVKATDSKSVGIFPRRFKSCRLRNCAYICLPNFLFHTRNCNTSVELSLRGTCLHLKWRYWNSLLMKSFFNIDKFKRVLHGDFFQMRAKFYSQIQRILTAVSYQMFVLTRRGNLSFSLGIVSGHHGVVKLNLLEDILNHSRSSPWSLVPFRTWFHEKKCMRLIKSARFLIFLKYKNKYNPIMAILVPR